MEHLDFEIKTEKETAGQGRFVIEPLMEGYGTTLGTSLRRVLLSSLPGAAVAEVRIQGVTHPFTTIKGIKEDVVELLLNLKKIRFIFKADGPFEGTIEAKGKRTITAGDIKVSSEVEVANPDLKIATLTDKDSKLSLSTMIEKGVGYKPSEERERGKIGVIPLDSIFSPVLKVAFRTEGARVGRKTNFERLVLDITTDETVKPSRALGQAAEILRTHLERVAASFPPAKIPTAAPKKATAAKPKKVAKLSKAKSASGGKSPSPKPRRKVGVPTKASGKK
ncbi:MAG: DNA-directed RNA polymerase subunit alpha [Patescibacteria group bacterium]